MTNTPNKIIVHHTGGSDASPLQDSSNFTFVQCEVLHKERFNMKSSLGFWTGYQYYIEKSGILYQARADTDEGAHTIGQNTSSLGICLAGNFDATLPTPEQIKTLTTFLQQKLAQYNIPASQVFPHRKFAVKTCYGDRLSNDWASKLVNTPDKDKIKQQIIQLVQSL